MCVYLIFSHTGSYKEKLVAINNPTNIEDTDTLGNLKTIKIIPGIHQHLYHLGISRISSCWAISNISCVSSS